MKREANALSSLQDFVGNLGILPTLKRGNLRIQTGEKWVNFERQMCINGLMTELHSPWQNMTEHSINDLGVMIIRCMKEFSIPLNQYHWIMQ